MLGLRLRSGVALDGLTREGRAAADATSPTDCWNPPITPPAARC